MWQISICTKLDKENQYRNKIMGGNVKTHESKQIKILINISVLLLSGLDFYGYIKLVNFIRLQVSFQVFRKVDVI